MIWFSQTFPQFNPGIIVVGFCFSMNSDVSWLLRRCGISATMFLTHDLRTITNNPLAELNEVQKQLLKEIGIFIIFTPTLLLMAEFLSPTGALPMM